ncbi:hypothetical protein DUI87_08025 [Hirundo rustica rustica]|uniref:Uncharacterized protein n=1 Tax=Hirundo rustica rustica TaxID=333673 RepID=A0A3M0KT17_HIRRU|nr:hypothetical protein DUI87_08025 [Hirundo rustica rustica]
MCLILKRISRGERRRGEERERRGERGERRGERERGEERRGEEREERRGGGGEERERRGEERRGERRGEERRGEERRGEERRGERRGEERRGEERRGEERRGEERRGEERRRRGEERRGEERRGEDWEALTENFQYFRGAYSKDGDKFFSRLAFSFFPLAREKQLKTVSSRSVNCCLEKETGPQLSPTTLQGVVESDKITSESPFLQAKQPQFPQLFLTVLVFQAPHQPRCPPLDTLKHLNVIPKPRGPGLDTTPKVWPDQC